MMTGTRRPYLIFCPLQGEWWGKWRPSGALTRTCRKQAVRRCRSERKQRDLALKNTQNGPRAAGCTERYRTGQLGGAVPWWVCRLWSPIAWRCRLLSKNKPAATKKKKKKYTDNRDKTGIKDLTGDTFKQRQISTVPSLWVSRTATWRWQEVSWFKIQCGQF